jgi:hypothetical protein
VPKRATRPRTSGHGGLRSPIVVLAEMPHDSSAVLASRPCAGPRRRVAPVRPALPSADRESVPTGVLAAILLATASSSSPRRRRPRSLVRRLSSLIQQNQTARFTYHRPRHRSSRQAFGLLLRAGDQQAAASVSWLLGRRTSSPASPLSTRSGQFYARLACGPRLCGRVTAHS